MKIAIARLEEGVHEYEYDFRRQDVGLDEGYGYDYGVHLAVSLTKMGDEYLVQGRFDTQANLICDRCGEPFVGEVHDGFIVLFTLSPKLAASKGRGRPFEEIRTLSPGSLEIDLTEDVRQSLIVALPLKRLCSEDCRGLCAGCGANLNFETCRCPTRVADPRWDALKKLLE